MNKVRESLAPIVTGQKVKVQHGTSCRYGEVVGVRSDRRILLFERSDFAQDPLSSFHHFREKNEVVFIQDQEVKQNKTAIEAHERLERRRERKRRTALREAEKVQKTLTKQLRQAERNQAEYVERAATYLKKAQIMVNRASEIDQTITNLETVIKNQKLQING